MGLEDSQKECCCAIQGCTDVQEEEESWFKNSSKKQEGHLTFISSESTSWEAETSWETCVQSEHEGQENVQRTG